MSGIYDGPDGQRLHGDGKPVVSSAPDWWEDRTEAIRKLPPICKGCGRIVYNCDCSNDN